MTDTADENQTASPPQGREERIREAAYRMFESRDDGAGDATTDWLLAEAEVDGLDGEARDGEVPPVDGRSR